MIGPARRRELVRRALSVANPGSVGEPCSTVESRLTTALNGEFCSARQASTACAVTVADGPDRTEIEIGPPLCVPNEEFHVLDRTVEVPVNVEVGCVLRLIRCDNHDVAVARHVFVKGGVVLKGPSQARVCDDQRELPGSNRSVFDSHCAHRAIARFPRPRSHQSLRAALRGPPRPSSRV